MILAPNLGGIIVRSEMKEKIGLIFVPETTKKNPPVEGIVVALAKDVLDNGYVKAGDRVVFGKYAAIDIPDSRKDEKLFYILEGDILYIKTLEEYEKEI